MKDKPAVHINRLQHIGIPVVDITVSEIFYKRLGFSNIMQSEFALEGKKGICIMMENSGVIIELYQLPEDKMEEIKSRKDGHIDHIAFDVDDIETAFTA